MTDAITAEASLRAELEVAAIEIVQLKRALRITRERLEDATIELECLRRAPTLPAPPLASDSCLPVAESRGGDGA